MEVKQQLEGPDGPTWLAEREIFRRGLRHNSRVCHH